MPVRGSGLSTRGRRRPHSRQYSCSGAFPAPQRGDSPASWPTHPVVGAPVATLAGGGLLSLDCHGPAAIRAEAGAPEQRRPALTAGGRRAARLEQRVDLGQTLVDCRDLRALVVEQVLTEAVLPVHLQDESAEVADPFVAQTLERSALAPQLPNRWRGAAAGPRRRRSGCGVGRASEDAE